MAKQLTNLTIKRIASVDSPAINEEFLIMKSAGKIPPGMSEKEFIWSQIEQALDKYMSGINDRGYQATWQNGVKVGEFTPKSREAYFAEFLKTSEGKKLYNAYDNASDERTPVNHVEKSEAKPTTIKQYADSLLEKIAKKYQAKDQSLTIEQAHTKASQSPEYQTIYDLGYNYKVANVDWTREINKRSQDDIAVLKEQINYFAKKAEV